MFYFSSIGMEYELFNSLHFTMKQLVYLYYISIYANKQENFIMNYIIRVDKNIVRCYDMDKR